MTLFVSIFSLGAFAIVALACLVGLHFIDRLRQSQSIRYRSSWLAVGGLILGYGMWTAHFLWLEGSNNDLRINNFPVIAGGLLVSFLTATAVLWFAISSIGRTLSTISTVVLIFSSFLWFSLLWSHAIQTEQLNIGREYVLAAIGLLILGAVATWWAKSGEGRERRPTWPYAGLSTVGIVSISYSSFQLASYLIGSPIKDVYSGSETGLFVFANSSVLLVAAWAVSVFEKRFRGTLRKHEESEAALLTSEKNAKAIMDTAFDPFVSTMEDGTIVEWNQQAQNTFGWSKSEAVGENWLALIFTEGDSANKVRELKSTLSTNATSSDHRVEICAIHRNGRVFPVELTIWLTSVGGASAYNAFLHDISERQSSSRRIAAQTGAAAALLESTSIDQAAPKVLSAICSALRWSVGALWSVDRNSNELKCEFFWESDEGAFPIFRESTEGMRLSLGIGIPGRVFMHGKPLWIEDIAQDSWFSRAKAAELDGLRAAFGFPIWGEQGPIGVVEFFSSSIQQPDKDLLEMMDTIGTLLGSFIRAKDSVNELARERMFLAGLLENLSDGIIACNEEGDLTVLNRATREFHSLSEEAAWPKQWSTSYNLLMPDGITPMMKAETPLFRALRGETIRDVELVIAQECGKARTVLCNGQPLVGSSGELLGAVVAMHDITDKKISEERLTQLAHFDCLTALPNRTLFYETLVHSIELAKEEQSGFCVMFLDLDRFKEVNDSLGHAAGDDLLRQVSTRLVRCLRTHDTIGRMGGDEFAIIIPGMPSIETVVGIADKIRHTISQPFEIAGKEVNVSTSMGITFFPEDSTEIHTLIKFADTAMYAAKDAGKNRYRFYTPEMNERALAKMEIEFSLRRAIEQGEFTLYYQPKSSLVTGAITGLEALLRWEHPARGTLLPVHFVDILEETGMINAVGEWVLRSVCEQIDEWRRVGLTPPRVAVNVSAKQFLHDHKHRKDDSETNERALEKCLISLLEQYPSVVGNLEIEIAESGIMSSDAKSIESLEHIKALGISIAIDDFGTGYSSLSYLKKLPIDSLKIDREFVADVVTDKDDAAIISAIISMAHSLGLKVVAEGVETEDQLLFLKNQGCDEAQGYYIARPFLASELKGFMMGRVPSTLGVE